MNLFIPHCGKPVPETRAYQVRLQEEINQNREYKSSKPICTTCSLLSQCTESKDHLCHYVDVKSKLYMRNAKKQYCV